MNFLNKDCLKEQFNRMETKIKELKDPYERRITRIFAILIAVGFVFAIAILPLLISTVVILFSVIVVVLRFISNKKENKDELAQKYNKKDYEKIYQLHINTDKLYNQRINFFMVAESMLIISYVTTFNRGIGEAISIIGLIFTSIWLYSNARSGERTLYMIRNYLEKDPIYKDYIRSIGGQYSKPLLTYSIPISLNLLWIHFLCKAIGINPWIWIIELFLAMVVISIWMNWYHIPK